MKTEKKDVNKELYTNGMVSIIIPIYNTYDYLPRCIESVIQQTYRNLQIILVDDGSTDNSLDICETYARKDRRIMVIYKTNGGVSSARNVGLANAVGEYISFIDSDDWVELDFIEMLVHDMVTNKTDGSMCERTSDDVYQDKLSNDENYLGGRYEISGVEACERLCETINDRISKPIYFVTDKIFKNSIWKNQQFDEGLHNGEDAWALYTVFQKVEKLGVINKKLYHYHKNRKGSLTYKKDMDCDVEVAFRMYDATSEQNRNLNPYIENIVICLYAKMRLACLLKDVNNYYSACQVYKAFYPIGKHRMTKSKYKLFSVAVIYFPRTLYTILLFRLYIQNRMNRFT